MVSGMSSNVILAGTFNLRLLSYIVCWLHHELILTIMRKACIFLSMTLTFLNVSSQEAQFQTKFSEPFAVFQFIRSLSAKSPDNVYKKLFNASRFNTTEYHNRIDELDSLNINYVYDFTDYPPGQKVGIDIPDLLSRDMILSDSMQEFKMRSMGLLPNEKLFRLVDLINAFTPVYHEVIYVPSETVFRRQLAGVTARIRSSRINHYFSQALSFYNSSWDYSVPFVLCFYPLPHSRGFTATAISNVLISAMADSLEDYNALLSVMLHEVSHVVYDERSLALWNQLESWFETNPSRSRRYANSLFNEAMATAVGNGYLAAQLNGKEDTTRRWYG